MKPIDPWEELTRDARIGRELAGRYRIEAVLGEGGVGKVYRATSLALGAPVAVKFLLGYAARQEEPRARFKREAAALARLRHPGIVAVHDFGEDEGDLYIVMDLVDGPCLADVIRDAPGPMGFERVVAVTDEVLKVVEAAHAANIVHRDLKPDNVMLLDAGDRTEHVKVLDFGIALMDDRPGGDRLTATNAVQGTPRYMSPEQCRGRDVGPPADVYAMGVVLYEMLAGDTPFAGESMMDVMAAHMFVLPPPIAERGVRRAVPAELERIARWALAKRPEDRPTATAFRDAIALMRRGGGAAQVEARTAEERVRALGLSREERALGPAPLAAEEPAPWIEAPDANGERPLVLVWGFAAERAEALRGSFAVNGLDARVWSRAEPPGAIAGRAPKAIVIAGAAGAEGARAARAAKVPVLVADVASPAETPALVRAGASDVGLASIGDDALCAKLKRLIERGR